MVIVPAYIWPVLLLLAAVQLIAYCEPEGAWEASATSYTPHTG